MHTGSVQATVDEIAAQKGLDSRLLDHQFSGKLLIKIASLIPDWREYAGPLGLTQQEVNGINTDPQLTYRTRTQELLRTWYKTNAYSKHGKYRELVQVSCDLQQADVAGEICRVIKGMFSIVYKSAESHTL